MADTQWEELDGSATLVRSKADRYTAIADAIQRSTKALDSIVTEISTKSLAMDETRNLAETVRRASTRRSCATTRRATPCRRTRTGWRPRRTGRTRRRASCGACATS